MAKSKRIKKQDDIYTILTTDQADTHLAKLGQLQRQLEALEANADTMINQVKEDVKRQAAPIIAKIQKHIRSLESFSKKNRSDVFGKKQSTQLTFGLMGFRKSSSISVKQSTVQLIKDIFKSKAKQFLHLKESPDKTHWISSRMSSWPVWMLGEDTRKSSSLSLI